MLAGVAGAFALAALTGCADGNTVETAQNGDQVYVNSLDEYKQELPDGRTLFCVGDGHGLSCDWANAK